MSRFFGTLIQLAGTAVLAYLTWLWLNPMLGPLPAIIVLALGLLVTISR